MEYTFLPIDHPVRVTALVTAFDAVHRRDFDFAGEAHNFWEMLCLVDGEAGATADDRVVDLKPGDLLFHQPMEFHRIWAKGRMVAHILVLTFTAEGDGMEVFRRRLIHLTDEQVNDLYRLVMRAHAMLEKAETDKAAATAESGAVGTMMEGFLVSLSDTEPSPAPIQTGGAKQYGRIIRFLEEHHTQALTIEAVARGCHMSASNLKRVFRQYSGCGVMDYFQSLKIRHARKLLTAGMSAVEIADRLGYSSPAYFHVVFKRITGMTPGAYVRSLR